MADNLELIISAIDNASSVFQDIISSVQTMADGVTGSISQTGSDFETITENVSGFQNAVENVDSSSLDELATELGMSTDEVERLLEAGSQVGTLSAGFNEAAIAADELEQETEQASESVEQLGSAGDVMVAQTFMDMASSMKDGMLEMADSAGTFQDSIMRASLEAEGAGIPIEQMTSTISGLSDATGRSAGQIRESFIKALARGVTDMGSFETMMKGAGAQATLLGTDIQTMGDKFSSMAQKDTLMARTLAETGITMQELGTAMGMTGATADEVKAKWKELDTNQRAAILGQAASMNEGESANESYKTSWAGLQDQMNRASDRLLRIAGSVLLPVLIPAMKIAGDVVNGLGDAVDFLIKSPLGGLVSILGAAGGAFVIAVSGAVALRQFLGFLKLETMLDSAATILNTGTKILNGEASGGAAIANALLGESFMASAAAAWTAAAGFLAATWPLLVIVGVIALVVYAVYELGKSFGWWTDVSTMIDAIKAGIMRLWDAFINHPDVQALIQGLTDIWNALSGAVAAVGGAVMEFFNINTGGNFDIVRALIEGIGLAWQLITAPIRMVISVVRSVINIFSLLLNGQITFQQAVLMIWTTLRASWTAILNGIRSLIIRMFSSFLTTALARTNALVTGVIRYFQRLPGRVLNLLLRVAHSITSAGSSWINNARSKASSVVSAVTGQINDLPGKVYTEFMGIGSRMLSAGSSLVQKAKNIGQDIVNGLLDSMGIHSPGTIQTKVVNEFEDTVSGIANISGAAGKAAGLVGSSIVDGFDSGARDLTTGKLFDARTGEFIENTDNTLNINETITLDLKNIPSNLDHDELMKWLKTAVGDKGLIRILVENNDFQELDMKVKQTLVKKAGRRG